MYEQTRVRGSDIDGLSDALSNVWDCPNLLLHRDDRALFRVHIL